MELLSTSCHGTIRTVVAEPKEQIARAKKAKISGVSNPSSMSSFFSVKPAKAVVETTEIVSD